MAKEISIPGAGEYASLQTNKAVMESVKKHESLRSVQTNVETSGGVNGTPVSFSVNDIRLAMPAASQISTPTRRNFPQKKTIDAKTATTYTLFAKNIVAPLLNSS